MEVTQAKLQNRVAQILHSNPFADEILNLTTTQMLFILMTDSKGNNPEGSETYSDPDFAEKMKRETGEEA